MKLFNRFRSSEVKISSPHGEKNPPIAIPTLEAKFRAGAFEPNDHYFANKHVLRVKREFSINPEKWQPLCALSDFAQAPAHLADVIQLRNKCAVGHYLIIDTTIDQAFLLACTSLAISTLKRSQGDPASWKQVDLVSKPAVDALARDICMQFAELKRKFPVELDSLHYYTPQADKMALRYITLLVISLAYERGTKVNAQVVHDACDIDWSSKKAKSMLRETFGSPQADGHHPNWSQLQSILKNAESYCREKPRTNFTGHRHSGAYGSTSSTSSHSTRGGQAAGNTAPNGSTRAETVLPTTAATPAEESSYRAALANAQETVAAIIGKMPPGLHTAPRCGYSEAGNLTDFFNMSATDRGEQAQTRVKQQYRAILRAIHPDKHAGEDAATVRAFMDTTKQYTAAYDEATKWYSARGA